MTGAVQRNRLATGLLAVVCILGVVPAAWAQGFIWPATGSVSSLWGDCRDGCSRYHAGIDIANSTGTPIYAACQGTVIYRGTYSGYGNAIDIQHAGNWVTRYGHLSGFNVSNGQVVTRGQHIGYMGNTGVSTGPHLHFEIRQGQTFGFSNSYNIPASRGQWISAGTLIPATYSGSSCSPPIPSWDATYHAQSYPSSMQAGTTAIVWAEFVNKGSQTWAHCQTRLGTSSPQDRNSPFCNLPNWSCANLSNPGCHRPTDVDQSSVVTNAVGRFTFILKAPTTPGTYVEKFRLVREGVTWFGPEITWTITVTAVTGNLTGTVTNASSGAALSGATVSLSGIGNTTTNSSGVYNFNNVAAGSYTVSASKTSFNGANANVSITAGQTTTQNFALTPSDTQAPSTPTGLAGNATGPTTVQLTWNAATDNVGVTGYDIRRDGAVIGSSTSTSYTDNAATANTTHSYTVRAKDAVPNYSAYSAPASVTTPPTPPAPTTVFSDGFNGNLNNWTQQVAGFAYSTAANRGGLTGAGAAFVAAGEADQMYKSFARPFAQGVASGYFWDGKGGWKTSVCGWQYRQTLSLREPGGSAAFMLDNCLASNVGAGEYYYRYLCCGWASTYTAIGARDANTDCEGTWVHFQTTITPGAPGANPGGSITLRVTDRAGAKTATPALDPDFFNWGIGRITLGFGVTSANEGYWDDITFTATPPGVPTMGSPTVLAGTQIQWNFSRADNNLFGWDVANTGGTAVSPQYPASGWVDRTATSWTESGLTPNTAYSRKVRAWNGTLNSGYSNDVTARTLSPALNAGSVLADEDTVCVGDPVTWTAVGGFGPGKVEYYEYAWNQDDTYSFTGSEAVWSSGTLELTGSAPGTWYLHVRGFNGDDVANGTFTYAVTCDDCTPPAIVGAVSRKVHGEEGIFDLDVSVPSTVEGRSGGPTEVIVYFDAEIQSVGVLDVSDVSVSSGAVTAIDIVNGSELHLELAGATSGDVLHVGFPGISNPSGLVVADALCFRVLTGDTNGDGQVNILDLVAVRNELNLAPHALTFNRDVTADGFINVLDLVAVRNTLNQSVTTCP